MDFTVKGGLFIFGIVVSLWFLFLVGFVMYWQKGTIFLTDENVQNYVADWHGKVVAINWVTYNLFLLIMWQNFFMMRKKVAHGPVYQGKRQGEWHK